MRRLFKFQSLILLALALLFTGTKVEAQGRFDLSVTASSSTVLVSNSVTYTIYVTNLNADLPNTVVTNTLPDSVEFVSAQSSQGVISNYNDKVIVFNLGTFVYTAVAQMNVTARPTTAGFFTNFVSVSYFAVTNIASTNVVVEVTNTPLPQVDLGVLISGPAQAVITNDLTSYEVAVTNAGPDAAPAVALTNSLPPGVILISASKSYTLSGSNMVFNLGTLDNGGHTNVQISIQPTNVAVLTLSASVGASGVEDTNTTDNTASNSLPVISYLSGTLLAVTNSAQTLNLQNGLTEQSILVSNVGTNNVDAVRLVVTGLTNQLFNVVGTNNGNPFVIYGSGLATNQSVNLLLQFFPRGGFPFTNGQLQAFAVPVPDWTPPAAVSTSTNINISRIVPMANGNMLIEFPAVSNRAYTVVYSDNVSFSNAMIAPPSIVAPANRVQWIDYGPPTTTNAPTKSVTRFYRVFQNP